MFPLFLLAYTCSGLAGLIYEVSWTRLLTLYIGHTTAAASAVVAAFLGGLALGAWGGGRVAARLTPTRSLWVYAALEGLVVLAALAMPHELRALTPLLSRAYADGSPSWWFPMVRLATCVALVCLPALALGATFPLAVRWCVHRTTDAARITGALYAMNTVGATVGAICAGFSLIPSIGVSGTIHVGMAASLCAAGMVAVVAWRSGRMDAPALTSVASGLRHAPAIDSVSEGPVHQGLAIAVLGLSGCASLIHEIAWTRILALLLGPTTYAFAATLAAVVAGVAMGSGLGTWVTSRRQTGRHALWLALTLGAGALAVTVTAWLAGDAVPRAVAQQVAQAPDAFTAVTRRGMLLTALLIVPPACCLGLAFPLGLALAGGTDRSAARRFGLIYAVNTVGAVSGTLLAGFVLIPALGLPTTLAVAAFLLIAAGWLVVTWGPLAGRARVGAYAMLVIAAVATAIAPEWNRALLASGVYLYAPFVPKDLDLHAQLTAGDLLYYKDGAPATVSVKRLTGTTTLAVDGKTDASNRSDMLTQALVAHLPLLLHPDPRHVAVVGLGSGVTLGAALAHPVTDVDVVEISPEVVDASRFFERENRRALADPRTHLIVGDGRSHLLLSRRQYDVIISEPSNPWIAGVAALFTREFFEGARARLAPGGVICQWAHTYTMSEQDLRAIVATFIAVFPQGSAWMVNDNDLLMVASLDPIEPRLATLDAHWTRGQAAESLAAVGAVEPFTVLSLYAGGPDALARFANHAPVLDDDRMRLEFSAPREIHNREASRNDVSFASTVDAAQAPAVVRDARARATAVQWLHRAQMMTKADAHALAYDDYVQALTLDPTLAPALAGLARTAVLTGRASDALSWVKSLTAAQPTAASHVATSMLLEAAHLHADAVAEVQPHCEAPTPSVATCEQWATLMADAGDGRGLAPVVARLQTVAPAGAATHYFTGVSALMAGDARGALDAAARAFAADPTYAATYDLAGAARTKLGQTAEAAAAFETSLSFDPHDSTAYTNLGLLALMNGQAVKAADLFAQALWLTPTSEAARRGFDDAMAVRR